MKVDFILVGQGLAGTLLAHELLRKNKSILVIDDPDQPKASEVAAGLINPIVFRWMTKSWIVDEAFPQLESTYLQLENLLNVNFYLPGELFRILSENEATFWKEKAIANQLENFLNPGPDFSLHIPDCNNQFGIGRITKAGRLDLPKLLHSFSDFLIHKTRLRKERFDFEKLQASYSGINYNGVFAEKIIFCEGAAASQNPYFKSLHFKHSKGEILELNIPDLKLKEILSRDLFIMPTGQNSFKVGATYSWDKLDFKPTPDARIELIDKLKRIIQITPEIISQQAGVRPTMHDRKPVLGLHPEHPSVGIFNGLGPKGALLGPYFARQFAEYLTKTSDFIHPEVNIDRYFRRK